MGASGRAIPFALSNLVRTRGGRTGPNETGNALIEFYGDGRIDGGELAPAGLCSTDLTRWKTSFGTMWLRWSGPSAPQSLQVSIIGEI